MERKKNSHFWNKPQFSDSKRSASLLELFFDIVVVSLIGGIGHSLISQFHHNQVTFFSLSFIILQTISTLITWRIITMYSIKFEINDIRHKIVIFSVMIPMIVMAAMGYVEKNSKLSFYINGFSFMMLSLIVFFVFYTAAISNKVNKYLFWYLMTKGLARLISFFIMIIVIVIQIQLTKFDILAEANTNVAPLWIKSMMGVWALIIIIQLTADIYSSSKKYSEHMPKINRELLKERYSILYIAFLGEMTILVISEFANNLTWTNIVYLFAAISQIFLMFWIYFDFVNFNDIKKTYKSVMSYSFIMLILFLSMLFISSGISLVMIHVEKDAILLYLIGTLLYWVASKIVLLSLNSYNIKERYIQPKRLNMIVTISWIPVLIVSLTLAQIYNSFNIVIWSTTISQLVTISFNLHYVYKSKKKYSSFSDKEFEKILPKNKVDW